MTDSELSLGKENGCSSELDMSSVFLEGPFKEEYLLRFERIQSMLVLKILPLGPVQVWLRKNRMLVKDPRI